MSKKVSLATLASLFVTLLASSAWAQDSASNPNDVKALGSLAAAIAIGVAVLGGALGQGRAAAAALEGISRNPGADGKIRTPMILGLALIESIALYALLIAYFLQGKVGGH